MLVNPTPEEFGLYITVVRQELGMTQSHLASLAGVSRSAITLVERGYNYPSFGNMVRIASALDIALDLRIGKHTMPKLTAADILPPIGSV